MTRKIFLGLIIGAIFLAGCASTEQTAPCPNYGNSCVKKSINSWE